MKSPDARTMRNIRPCLRQILIWYFTRKHRFAAEDFHNRLQIPFIELRRLYQTDKIASQYQAFGKVLGVTFSDEVYRENSGRSRGEIQRETAGCKLCDRGMHERRSI